ncbi:putative polysaccharide biosynthesis protein [Clostridium vitabionis]|uniref:putative polysaccharide biosynthesis protein n=1 Tax=Clostridium vitabionis TaxID=2784388 RepID=UPI001F25E583|nr:polysaccharide biosynthesis protein [Clostridium vitabionis]
MSRRAGSNFVVQGSILAVAGIIVRLIGILYRVPMTNIIGDEGMGYYSTAFNVYNIMLILSSYSLPVAVSKMISAKLAKREYTNAYRILLSAFLYATIVGGIACFITWHFADALATKLFATPLAVYALKTLAPTIWIMAYLGVLRGYFQGHSTMIPTAVSQILEQIVNAVISVVAAGILYNTGLKAAAAAGGTSYAEAFGAAGGTIGTGSGAFAAFLFCLCLFFFYRPTIRKHIAKDRHGEPDSYGYTTKVLFLTVIPVILSSTVYNVNSVIDNGIMAHGMNMIGQGGSFLRLWGIYNNKYMLLVHVPLAMANSLSSSLIPSLTAATAREDQADQLAKTDLVIRFAMMIAIPAAVGLMVLAAPVMNLLFHGGKNAEAIQMMIVGASAIVFLSLSTVTNAILQGLGHMNEPVKNALISLISHIVVLVILLLVFRMGIYAMVFGNIFFSVCMCMLNHRSIRRYIPYRQEMRKTFVIPIVSSAIMGVVTFLIYRIFRLLIHSSAASCLPAVFAAVLVYGAMLLRLHAVEESELAHMPGGRKIIGIARTFHLL